MSRIRVGIGGWSYPPWRETFYPPGLPRKRELEHASRQVTAIEINATFYGSQKPESFRRWREEAPDGFVFAVKGPRYATHRRALGEAGPSIARFFDSGVLELGAKLGPVLWQFPPTTAFDPDGFAAFLDLVPRDVRHVVEVRHPSFADPRFIALLRQHGTALARIDAEGAPDLPEEPTAAFVYARLKRAAEAEPAGYPAAALDAIAARARGWAVAGEAYVFFINGAKVRAPAAAMALLERLRVI